MRRLAPVVALLLAASGPASAADKHRDPSKAAQAVALARLVPSVCEDVVTDREAIAAFMTVAGLGEADLGGRYAAAVDQAVRAFRDSVERDEDAACSQAAERLGQKGLGLVGESGMGDH